MGLEVDGDGDKEANFLKYRIAVASVRDEG